MEWILFSIEYGYDIFLNVLIDDGGWVTVGNRKAGPNKVHPHCVLPLRTETLWKSFRGKAR